MTEPRISCSELRKAPLSAKQSQMVWCEVALQDVGAGAYDNPGMRRT
ncbi:hypothetical protein GGR01_000551 [Acetobacter oeni]|nr:hypothetical protein [Acetobacter oeni]